MESRELNFDLQYRIIRQLSTAPITEKRLVRNSGRGYQVVSTQLSYLLKNGIVSFDYAYDDEFGRRVRQFSLTSIGKIALAITDNYAIYKKSLYDIANEGTEIISAIAKNSISNLDDKIAPKNNTEPITFCRLNESFFEQPFLSAFQRMNIDVNVIEGQTSDDRLNMVLDKKCGLVTIPEISIEEHFKNRKHSMAELIIVGVMDGQTPTKLVKGDMDTDSVYYSGGSGRKKLAMSSSNNPIETSHEDILKGVLDGNYKKFVTNDPDPVLLEFEGDYKVENIYYDRNYLVTHIDELENGSEYIKKIYRQSGNVFWYTRKKNLILKEVIPYVVTELRQYIKQNANIFKNLMTSIKSESRKEFLSN